jgi:hypothetical protein
MYKLILLLFVAALMFGCSKEEAEEMMDKAGEMAEEAVETASEMAEETTDAAKEMMDETASMDGPKLEPLPDWDSLPPIEEEMAAEEGGTMMEKAEEMVEEKAEEVVEMAKDKAKDMMKKE